MKKHCFIVTSAVNSKFGVFNPEQRLTQTIETISSIKKQIPDAKIVIMECCGNPILPAHAQQLKAVSDLFLDYSDRSEVQDIYQSDNWDIVKNGTEIMCFGWALRELKDSKFIDQHNIDRIHKMSGRYVLNDQFNPKLYESDTAEDRIVIGPKFKSQFAVEMTTQPWQYMARLWSWPSARLDEVIEVYEDSFIFFSQRLAAGGYIDIEHVLAKFLDPQHVLEVTELGVEGQIAPNGAEIKN
jgi:hypothetical protein